VIGVLHHPRHIEVLWRKKKRNAALSITAIAVIVAHCEKKHKLILSLPLLIFKTILHNHSLAT
jgi:hypothetical protein